MLRFWNIDATSLWIDEIYSLMVAQVHSVPTMLHPSVMTAGDYGVQYLAWQPMDWPQLLALLKINVHMPLYYLLLNPWLGVFGNDATGLRTFSALFSALLLLPVYGLGCAFGGRRAGLLAAFVAAVAPFQIYFAQEGRMYTLTLFWATLSALSLWKTLYGGKPFRWSLLYALSTALAVLSHYMAVFFLVFEGLYAFIWLLHTRNIRRFALLGLALAALIGVAVLWLPVYQAQQANVDAEYHFAKGMVNPLRYLTALVWQPLVMLAGDNRLQRVFYIPVCVLLFLFYAVSAWRPAWFGEKQLAAASKGGNNAPNRVLAVNDMRFRWRREGFLLLWVFVPVLAQMTYDLLKQTHTVVVDRYVLLISPAMLLLLALSLARLLEVDHQRKTKTLIVLVGLLLASMLTLAMAAIWNPSPFRDEHNKKDERGKMAYFLKHARPDDLVFVNGPLGVPNLAAYYLLHPADSLSPRPDRPMLYWISRYRNRDVPLPPRAMLAPYRRVWLYRTRANNERGLQTAKEYLQSMFPRVIETETAHDWFVYSR